MVDILHRVGIGSPAEKVYKTLTTLEGNKAWWDSNATGDAAEGGLLTFFKHAGWVEPVEFMHHCSTKWATFLLSLKQLLETGKGRPAPDEVKIYVGG